VSDRPPPNEFAVVGENADDPDQLLLQDPDGAYYALSLPGGEATPIDPDEHWRIETDSTEDVFT
jgi:hypothetical protein